jgi:hypothetical protein
MTDDGAPLRVRPLPATENLHHCRLSRHVRPAVSRLYPRPQESIAMSDPLTPTELKRLVVYFVRHVGAEGYSTEDAMTIVSRAARVRYSLVLEYCQREGLV